MTQEDLLYQDATNKLVDLGVVKQAKEDANYLLSLFRPEYMIDDNTFRKEGERLIDKWRLKSKEEQYDRYESDLIRSVSTQLFELIHKAYITII